MNRTELVKTLELIKPALAAANDPVPIFKCFCFGERVSAYNDTIGIVAPTDFDVGGAVGLHGVTLLGLLSSSSVEDVTFAQKDSEITLTMGKAVSKLPFYPSEDFIFNVPEDNWNFKLQFTESLFEALQIALETVSKDETQPALQGITLQGDKLYSCCGDSLTRFNMKGTIGKHRVLLPTPFCHAVSKLWQALKVTKGILQFNDEWVYADFGDWSVYGRLLEITDPIDFESLIKRNLKANVATEEIPDDFSEALSRARVLSDPESQKTTITVSKGKIGLVTETYMGEVRDTIVFSKSHPEVVANVNAAHLQRAVTYCDKIAIHKDCVLFEKDPDILMLVSNMS